MAYPVLLNYLLSNVFELLDKAIVGHYSVQGFAVAGAAASFTYAITGALGILSAAFNIAAAEEKGRENEQGFETTFLVCKYLALLIGICFFVLSLLGGHFFFQNVYGIQGNELSELLSYFYQTSAVKEYLKCGIQMSFDIIAFLCVLCGIFNKVLLHLIINDLHIIGKPRNNCCPSF